MREDLARLFRHGGIYLLGNILNRVGAFLLLPLYTTYLSVGQFGTLEILYSTVSIASVLLSAGLSHTTIRFYFDKKSEAERNTVVMTNFSMVFFLGAFGALVLIAFRSPLSVALLGSTDYGTEITLCLLVMVLEMSSEIGYAYLRARERSIMFIWLSFGKFVVQVVASIYLVASAGLGIKGVLFANLTSVAIVWLFLLVFMIRNCGVRLSFADLGPMFKYSVPMALTGLVGAVASNVDRFLLKDLLTIDAVGLYALAMKFAMLLAFAVSEPFARAYGPFRFSVLDRPDATMILANVVKLLAAGVGWVALGIALTTPYVLLLMATPEYFGAHAVVPVLLLAFAVSALSYCFETGILVKKRTSLMVPVSLLGLVLKVVLNLMLIPLIGVHGAAWAFVCTSIVHMGLIHYLSGRLLPIRYPWVAILRFFGLAIACYLASLAIGNWSLGWALVGKSVIFAAYLGLACRMDPEIRGYALTAIRWIRANDRIRNRTR